MKKLGFIAVLLASCSLVHAASVDWQLNTAAKVTFDTKSVGKNATAFVVFLGTQTLDALTYKDIMEGTQVGDSYTTSLGQVTGKNVTVDSETGLGNYAFYMTFVGTDEKTYVNVSTSLYTLTAADVNALLNEGTALPASSFSFSDSKPTSSVSSTSASSGGWVAVPEPSTAALALAGLALLLKRRKA